MAPTKRTKEPWARGTNLIGARIREIRESLTPAVTQSDLAARVSVQRFYVGEKLLELDRPTITRIENGQRYLRDYEIIAIARALKVTVSSLFEGRIGGR